MTSVKKVSFVAFDGPTMIAEGPALQVARQIKQLFGSGSQASYLVFDEATGRQIDFDLRGSDEELIARLQESCAEPGEAVQEVSGSSQGKRGRPKLGVVAREVTLLPRHWEWLNSQPGGASVALRKLVDEARKSGSGADSLRAAQEAAYRFMSAMAGNLPGFEEATRALFRGDRAQFERLVEGWPEDICRYARKFAAGAFSG